MSLLKSRLRPPKRQRLHATPARQILKPRIEVIEEPADDARDAARWRALASCPGLRVLTTVPQRYSLISKEPGYRYLVLEAATHGYGGDGRMHKPDLLAFADYLIKRRRNKT